MRTVQEQKHLLDLLHRSRMQAALHIKPWTNSERMICRRMALQDTAKVHLPTRLYCAMRLLFLNK